MTLQYETQSVRLSEGDVVVLMSDGFTELVDEHGMMLEPEQIVKEIEMVADEGPRKIITHLAQRAAVWRGNAPLRDDLTVVVLMVKA